MYANFGLTLVVNHACNLRCAFGNRHRATLRRTARFAIDRGKFSSFVFSKRQNMTKSRKRAKRNAEVTNAHQKAPDNAPPKTVVSRFARGLVLAEFAILIGMGSLCCSAC